MNDSHLKYIIKGLSLNVKNLQDHCPDPERYYHFTEPMKRSEPRIPLETLLEVTTPLQPYAFLKETDVIQRVLTGFFYYIVITVLRILRIKVKTGK